MKGLILLRHRFAEDVFAPPAVTGRPSRDRREVIDGIFRALRTGLS